ncbi:hypothetical protein Acsp04_47640 [Actinomadura sp. NBRC 104425]|uniref:hypothetical protein n=1 Tax=Actinomadura sp. NBRC 104425 TaxID=3032204 RepID=UPI00249FD955|nr:hypothetical protein [Actinomadura sp. NBRC 104425]GLZ14529.1 hypothetical protein Acsp04_47640 [Actinomadura sp. NBRC 104425]
MGIEHGTHGSDGPDQPQRELPDGQPDSAKPADKAGALPPDKPGFPGQRSRYESLAAAAQDSESAQTLDKPSVQDRQEKTAGPEAGETGRALDESEPVKSAEGIVGITRAMSREAARAPEASGQKASDSAERPDAETEAGDVVLDRRQAPADPSEQTVDAVAESGESEDADRSAAWRAHVETMKKKWAELESELSSDRPSGADGDDGSRGESVDRSEDEPGSWRGEGGQYLSYEENMAVSRVFDRVRDVEPGVTDALKRHEAEVKDAELIGLEYRLKGQERFKQKVAEKLEGESREDPERAAGAIHDALRYTYQIPADSYTRGYREIVGRLGRDGFEMEYSKNSWGKSEYKGINTRWRTPGGQPFEIQFHTPESFEAKQLTHGAYEQLRNPPISEQTRVKMKAFQREVSAGIPIPEGVADIPDYRKVEEQKDG